MGIDTSGEPPIVRSTKGLYTLCDDKHELERLGPIGMPSSYLLRRTGGLLAGGIDGFVFLPNNGSPPQQLALDEGSRRGDATLLEQLPPWLKMVARVMSTMTRGIAPSPWDDDEWIAADDEGIYQVSELGKKTLWRAEHLVDGLTTVGTSVFAGFV